MLALNEFRSRACGLPDLLPWAALVDNGVVLTKGGGLMAAWFFTGPDLDSATLAELKVMAARINRALMLGDGWVLHCDALRAPAPGYAPQGRFPDRTSRLIDDVRRDAHLQTAVGFTSRYVLTAMWFPEPDAASRAADLFVEGRAQGTAARNLERFQSRLHEVEGRLSGFLHIGRLLDTELPDGSISSPILGYLDCCVMPGMTYRPRVMPEVPMYLDAILGRREFTTGFTPYVDNQGVACISLTDLPANSRPGILDFLSRLPVAYRWSTRFICMNEQQAQKEMKKYRSRWAQKRKSMANLIREASGGQATHVDTDAVMMADDAVAALAEASSGEVLFGWYTSVILLSHEDADVLDESAREVAKFILNRGFEARIETINAVEAFLGTMPGDTHANVRRPILHTLNLAHLLPLTSVWAGPEKNPCPFYPPDSPPLIYARTDGFTPYRLCLHAGDLAHTLIVGPTGSGKSALLALIAAQQFRYPRAQVFAFDKGYSMMPLVSGCAGEHYDIAGETTDLAFCPLARIDEPAEQAWAAEWLEGLAELQGVKVMPGHRQRIYEAVVRLAQSTTDGSERTLTNFVLTLQDQGLREAFTAYTLQGTGGSLLDAQSDALREDRFQVFEMEHLMTKGEKQLLPTLLYLFHRLEQRFVKGLPTLLLLDEAWVMLGHPIFRQKIVEWLKVLRRCNVAVVFSTQSLADLQRSGIADVLYESCPTKILLSNPSAGTENVRPLYEKMGLNSRQIDIVAMGTPKRDYYMVHPDGRRQFQLGLSGPELAFVGASGREDLARIRVLRDELGDAWPAQWLRERGEGAAAQRWESYQ